MRKTSVKRHIRKTKKKVVPVRQHKRKLPNKVGKYKVKYVGTDVLKDYAGMNHYAGKAMGFKPLPGKETVLVAKDMRHNTKLATINHEIQEAELMKKGSGYWPAHKVALKGERDLAYLKNRGAKIPEEELDKRNIAIFGSQKFQRVMKRQLGKQPELWQHLDTAIIAEGRPEQGVDTAYSLWTSPPNKPDMVFPTILINPKMIFDDKYRLDKERKIGTKLGVPQLLKHETGHIKLAREMGLDKYNELATKNSEEAHRRMSDITKNILGKKKEENLKSDFLDDNHIIKLEFRDYIKQMAPGITTKHIRQMDKEVKMGLFNNFLLDKPQAMVEYSTYISDKVPEYERAIQKEHEKDEIEQNAIEFEKQPLERRIKTDPKKAEQAISRFMENYY